MLAFGYLFWSLYSSSNAMPAAIKWIHMVTKLSSRFHGSIESHPQPTNNLWTMIHPPKINIELLRTLKSWRPAKGCILFYFEEGGRKNLSFFFLKDGSKTPSLPRGVCRYSFHGPRNGNPEPHLPPERWASFPPLHQKKCLAPRGVFFSFGSPQKKWVQLSQKMGAVTSYK